MTFMVKWSSKSCMWMKHSYPWSCVHFIMFGFLCNVYEILHTNINSCMQTIFWVPLLSVFVAELIDTFINLDFRNLLHINTFCQTPEKMAVTLLDYLFPREVLAVSNLSGKGKHHKRQLDPLMVLTSSKQIRLICISKVFLLKPLPVKFTVYFSLIM